ncbi:OTU domain [Trinorchestia longiramus]|nr:OTU domain [Trinorchestia longiramus]
MHSYMTRSAAKKAVVSAITVSTESFPTSKNVCSNRKTTATHKTRKGKSQIMAPTQPPSQDFNICSKTAAKGPASSANTQLSKHRHSSKKTISPADLDRKRSISVTNINTTHTCRTQQTLPKPLTSSVINELETKAAPRLTANEKLHNPHSGVHKALPERSTNLTTEDPNVQLNSVRGILNIPAHTGLTASATSASNKKGETTNNEEDCQSTAEVLRSTVTWPVQDSKAKHQLAYTNTTSTRVPTQISGQGNVSNSVSFDGSLHPIQIKSSHLIHKLNSNLALTATQLQKILEKRVPPKPTSISTALSNIQFIVEQLFKLNVHISSYDLIPITPSTISSYSNYQRPLNTLLVGDNILSTVKRNDIDIICRIQTISSESSSNPIYTHVGSSLDDVTKSLNATLTHTLADGHCFLHAVAFQLNEIPNSMQAYKFLMKAIETESTRNKNHHGNFIDENSGRLDLLVQKYLHSKIFDHAAGDLIPQITSNALQKPIHIYSERDGGI